MTASLIPPGTPNLPDDPALPSAALRDLVRVMAALRTPHTGCPWDLEQTFTTIAPYTIEEAYEVSDAIARGDRIDLKEELGDLLLQVVYHSQMASEEKAFTIDDVIAGIVTKMIRRHPHVFGDDKARSAGAAKGFWEKIKTLEKAEKAAERARNAALNSGHQNAITTPTTPCVPSMLATSLLNDVPAAMPALTRAIKLQDKAARVGFDWPSLAPVLAKMKEELAELEVELSAYESPAVPASRIISPDGEWASTEVPPGSPSPSRERVAEGRVRGFSGSAARIKDEFGDLLFVMANVARHLEIDPEDALRKANDKFTRRFHFIEAELTKRGSSPAQSTLEEMDSLWNAAKATERK